MAKKYDILIVGAGLYGATCARLLTEKGYKCLIVEKNNYVGGLCYTERRNDIDIHVFGPHIFHTDDEKVWKFITKYCRMNSYKHSETILSNERLWSLPIDLRAYNMMFGSTNSINAYNEVSKEVKNFNVKQPSSFEDNLILQYGASLYTEIFKPYYEKKFGVSCGELANIMPDMQPSYFRLANQMYYTDMQGIPEEGYTKLIENIIGNDIPIMLNKDFVKNMDKLYNIAEVIVYTGPIDYLCKYVYGPLKWVSLDIKTMDESIRGSHIYGNAVTKVADKQNAIIRITEHKWFTPDRNTEEWKNHNIVSYEYKKEYENNENPFYSINNSDSMDLYMKYYEYAESKWPNIIFGGSKALYINMNMSETVKSAIEICERIEPKD